MSTVLVGGCQDPQYKTAQAARDQRIQQLLKEYGVREEVRLANIDAVITRVEMDELEHARKLDENLLRVEETRLRDQREWLEEAAHRRELLRSSLAGKPERIPDSWRKMGY